MYIHCTYSTCTCSKYSVPIVMCSAYNVHVHIVHVNKHCMITFYNCMYVQYKYMYMYIALANGSVALCSLLCCANDMKQNMQCVLCTYNCKYST